MRSPRQPTPNSCRLLTTTLVVSDTYIALRLRVSHSAAVRFLDALQASPRIVRVVVGRPLEVAAENLLRQFADHRFSYTDAVSFSVMRTLAVTDVRTWNLARVERGPAATASAGTAGPR